MVALSKMAQDNIVKELPVSSSTVLPVFKVCVGCSSVRQHRGEGFRGKCFLSCLSPIKHLVDDVDLCGFLWHHHAIWNASCSQDAHTQVPTRGRPRPVSQVACLVLLWQHPRAQICQDVQKLRGSQRIHFITLTQAVWDYYLAVYKWSAILTATIAFTRRPQL